VFEQVELVVDQSSVELSHAIGMPEKVRPRVRKIVTRTIGHVVRNFDFFHLVAIDRMRTEIAWNGGHGDLMLQNGNGRLAWRPVPYEKLVTRG
jgi:hypothetical protein